VEQRTALQTVLITGATDGLGRAAAFYLAERGYRVIGAGRNAAKRAEVEQAARERKLPLEMLEMDVTRDDSVNAAVDEAERGAGQIDVLINNAGYAVIAPVEELKLDDLRAQFETNLVGVVRVTQRVLPAMRTRRSGRIINMSSIAGKFAWPLFGAYSASKHALEGLSDALRLELHPFSIHVVLIEPGFIPSNMGNVSADVGAEYVSRAKESPYAKVYSGFRAQWKQTIANAKSKPEDCARVVHRAITDSPPRPRYTVTRRAAILSVAKRVLPDSVIDRRTLRAYGLR
jgi:NAD(P)-dependent dehydrogenase (short-subunit alcohol dehydrogenase family)